MDINVVYSGHKGPPSLHHKGALGTVHVSEKRDPNKFNVFTHLVKPQRNDCFIQQEPIVVRASDYNIENLKNFHKVFTWFDGHDLPNIVKIDFPSHIEHPSVDDLKNNPGWKSRDDEIIIIANPKHSQHKASIYALREMLADELHRRGFKVSWYGHAHLRKPYYKGRAKDKFTILKRAKFSICSENTYDEVFSKNYLTEKLPHVIFSGCMPLYMGCFNIEEFGIDNQSMIDLRKFVNTEKGIKINFDALAHTISNFTESDYNIYREKMYKEREKKSGFFYRTDYHTAYEIMLRSLNQ